MTPRVNATLTPMNGQSHCVIWIAPSSSAARNATLEKSVAVKVAGKKIMVRMVLECIEELSWDIWCDMRMFVEVSCWVTMLHT